MSIRRGLDQFLGVARRIAIQFEHLPNLGCLPYLHRSLGSKNDLFDGSHSVMIAPRRTTETEDSDALLMARVAEGEEELFDDLVQRNESRVRGLVTHMKGVSTDTDDLTQQVFLQAYRARKSYCPTAKFTTWLFVITRNVVLNSQRSASRRHETLLASPQLVETPIRIHGERAACYDPIEEVIREETQRFVHDAISRLPDRQREAITLVGLRQQRYKVAAEQMQVTEKAIKSLVHRAKLNLRDMLDSQNPQHAVG